MANAIILKRLYNASQLIRSNFISSPNPTKITPKFHQSHTQILTTRQFSSNPTPPNLSSDPPAELCSEPTQISLATSQPNPDPKPMTEEPKAPKNPLVEFYKMRTAGFVTQIPKVFDKRSKRVRPFNNNRSFTHEKMNMFKRGYNKMPDVVAHIAVMEAYANAGQTNKRAQKVYLKMLGPGVIPNEFTYNLLIKLLASSRDWTMIGQSQKYLLEMLEKGIMPSAEACVAVLKALAREGKVREGREFLQDIKGRGFVVNDDVFREVVKGRGGAVKLLKSKRGRDVRTVLEILFAKKNLRG